MSTPAILVAGDRTRRKDFSPGRGFGPAGIAAIVGVHALIGWALMSGLARDAYDAAKKPLEAAIIEEVKLPPPPPPPPPPKQVVKEMPRTTEPPPPATVPPPEVTQPPVAEPPPTIAAVQAEAPPAPPPPAPPAPAPAPAPEPVRAGPVRQDIAIACPKQVKPVIPAQAIADGVTGKVRAEIRVKNGRVAEVQIVSGPRVYHGAVRAAVMQYQCASAGGDEIVATQEFVFQAD